MFGTKKAHIAQLTHRAAVLESNLQATERQLERSRSNVRTLERTVIARDFKIHKLESALEAYQNSPACDQPHQHNFTELELRIHADMLARPEAYEMGVSRGRWSGRCPSLQNLPRRQPEPVLSNVSFEYRGKRSTFPLGNSTTRLEVAEVDEGKTLRIVCHKPDFTKVHYDYRMDSITSEIRKEYK